jgi:hypothetical protein
MTTLTSVGALRRVLGSFMGARRLTAGRGRGQGFGRTVHRLLLRAANGALRPLSGLAYRFATLAYAGYLCRGIPRASAYVRGSLGSGRPLYGVSDIDLVVVLDGEGRERVRRRMDRLRQLPGLLRALVEWPSVFERERLAALAFQSALTSSEAIYAPGGDLDELRLLERPGADGPTAGWRRVRGAGEVPSGRAPEHVAAWLELQYWWRTACEGCMHPERLGTAALCVKLAAEPAGLWLRLARGERPAGRAETLEAAARALPSEAEDFERMLRLGRELARSPEPPLREALGLLVRLSELIAAELRPRAAHFTEVRLVREDPTEVRPWWNAELPWSAPDMRPLTDFRALCGRSLPDEVIGTIDADATDPEQVALLAGGLEDTGAYAEIRTGEISIRPSAYGRARLRGVQCALTDPLSFAAGDVANFPDLAGWSAHDVAGRAVAEHRAWLAAGPHEPNGETLGKLGTAARAASFLQSVGTAFDPPAREAYAAFGHHGTEPPPGLVTAFERRVRELPAYRS